MSDLGAALLALARAAIEGRDVDFPLPELDAPGATFVTLTRDGRLRGCIVAGARRPLRRTAYNAGGRIPGSGFKPPRRDELATFASRCRCSEPVGAGIERDDVASLQIRSGYVPEWAGRKGTFLPQEQLPGGRLLVEAARQAGFPEGFWSPEVRLKRYEVVVVGMVSHAGGRPSRTAACAVTCAPECTMRDGQRGFCFVRANEGGQLVLTTYGRSSGFAVDPIEKKPLNHFHLDQQSSASHRLQPGLQVLQNREMAVPRMDRLAVKASPSDIAAWALQRAARRWHSTTTGDLASTPWTRKPAVRPASTFWRDRRLHQLPGAGNSSQAWTPPTST